MLLSMLLTVKIALGAYGAETAGVKLKTVDSEKLPWAGDYSIRLEVPEGWSDPGDFTMVRIFKGAEKVYEFTDLQGERAENVGRFPKGTAELGQYLQSVPLDKAGNKRAIALANRRGASQDDALILIAHDDAGRIYEAFNRPLMAVAMADFDGDGRCDILSKGGRGEPASPGRSYDPYLVFRQSVRAGRIVFEVDEALSKRWSARNDFEWHGAEYDGKIRVDEHGKLISK